MKKIILSFILLTALYSHVYPQCTPSYTSGPNVYTCNNIAIATLLANCEFSAAQKASIKSAVLAEYASKGITSADILDEASTSYNCHAYAWQLTEGHTNRVWINQIHNGNANLSKYWSGSNPCFMQSTETNTEKIFYYAGDHSAVKSTVAGKYESKWGQLPLIRHAPTSVPDAYQGTYRRYYAKVSISGPDNPYSIQPLTYTVNNIPANTTVTWSGSSNINFIGGQTGESVTISICNISAATLTAILSGTVNDTLSRTLLVNNGLLTVVPQWGAIDVEYYHPYAQCYDWSIDTYFTSEIGSGAITCANTNILTLEPLNNSEGGYIQVRARANGCYSSWQSGEVSIWRPEIDGTNSYLNPVSGEPFWANLVEPVPDNGKIGTIQYYWYFDSTLFEITDEPYIHSYTWPCGDHNLTVVAHTDDLETSTMVGFWGMCIHGSSSVTSLNTCNK
ncbi:MAG: hypothetical protein LBS55_05585 [Prevotellaceae bacterium]|jgi:hypothetical protein|nr:hypothetical protein [Prevotellaceae bacterium]